MNFDKLINKGMRLINEEKLDKGFSNIVVIGSARGGTSLVAGALDHLGVYTGKQSSAPVFEDVMLSRAFETNNIERVRAIVSTYNKEHTLWAWKRPGSINYLNLVKEELPNALYIVIFKDIFSIANRNSISMLFDLSAGLKRAVSDYETIVNFLPKIEGPLLLVSAEKALKHKEDFVDLLINILSSKADFSRNREAAIHFISPHPEMYLDSSRITKYRGRVGGVKNNKILGWAMLSNSEKPADVELYLGDELYKTSLAIENRPHLVENDTHKTGMCGFSFQIDDKMRMTNKLIKIIGKSDIKPLENGIVDLKKYKID